MNVEFLGKFLESEAEYWIVASENVHRNRRGPDEIFLIARPDNAAGGIPYVEIRLSMLNDLANSRVQNVPLNTTYTPFQGDLKMASFYIGYPVPTNIVRDVLAEGLKLKSDSIFEFKHLIDGIYEKRGKP